jgi:hypothetical protein
MLPAQPKHRRERALHMGLGPVGRTYHDMLHAKHDRDAVTNSTAVRAFQRQTGSRRPV